MMTVVITVLTSIEKITPVSLVRTSLLTDREFERGRKLRFTFECHLFCVYGDTPATPLPPGVCSGVCLSVPTVVAYFVSLDSFVLLEFENFFFLF